MVLSLGGIIHPRFKKPRGGALPAIHFVIGGAWDVPTMGGHLLEGSLVKGVCQVFITELLGIDVLFPQRLAPDPHAEEFPENWYRRTSIADGPN